MHAIDPSDPLAIGFDEATFRKSLIYSAKGPVAMLQADLLQIRNLDANSQRQASKYGTWGALSVIGTIVCLVFVVICIVNVLQLAAAGAVMLVAVGLVTAIWSLSRYMYFSKTDVENRRYELADDLLRYLGADIKSETEVELFLNFNSYHKSAYRTEKIGNNSTYILPWLAMRGKFADGNRFEFSTELKVKRKEKPKRKYTKVKEDKTQDMTLELALRNPPTDEALLNHLVTIPPPPLQRYRAQVNQGKLILRAASGVRRTLTGRGGAVEHCGAHMAEREEFLRLFLTAYHCWNTFPRQAA